MVKSEFSWLTQGFQISTPHICTKFLKNCLNVFFRFFPEIYLEIAKAFLPEIFQDITSGVSSGTPSAIP